METEGVPLKVNSEFVRTKSIDSKEIAAHETYNKIRQRMENEQLKRYVRLQENILVTESQENLALGLAKIPTGIKTFDANIDGGFPAGSVILLLEDVGAGAREFLYTSIVNTVKQRTDLFEKKEHNSDENIPLIKLPDEICYISISKSKDDILKENAYAFEKDFYKAIKDGFVFKELSDIYFRNTIAQIFWDKKSKIEFDCSCDKNILEEIASILDEYAADNIIILDSLTELIMCEGDYLNKNDIIMFLKGLVRISKKWNGLIYLILSANILDNQIQEIVTDLVDGVLVFEWFDKGSVKMRRNLHISKFRGLMPRVEQNNIAKFETKITSSFGFEVSNVRKLI